MWICAPGTPFAHIKCRNLPKLPLKALSVLKFSNTSLGFLIHLFRFQLPSLITTEPMTLNPPNPLSHHKHHSKNANKPSVPTLLSSMSQWAGVNGSVPSPSSIYKDVTQDHSHEMRR